MASVLRSILSKNNKQGSGECFTKKWRNELGKTIYLDVLETVNTGDTVSDGEDTAGLLHVGDGGGAKDPLLQDAGDFIGGSLRTSLNIIDR